MPQKSRYNEGTAAPTALPGTVDGMEDRRSGKATLSGSEDRWGAFRTEGTWSLYGDEPWAGDVFRRKAAQQRALSWCSSDTRLSWGVCIRLVLTVVVFSVAFVRWRLRTLLRRGRRRAVAADEFRRAAERLGATWIKLGQLIAAGEGIFPDELVASCRELHDRVRPEPRRSVEKVLLRSFGPAWRQELTLDPTPLAAASIAQTHRATLRDGSEVVVKVQRHGVARRVERDVRALSRLAPYLVGRIPVAALANPPALVDLFARCVGEELDFCVEAANACDVARVVARYGSGGVVVPRPHPTLVREQAMVIEYVPGSRIEEVDPRLGARIIDTLAATVLEGALLGGVFHGDLHPGNMAFTPGGDVVLYDFGIVARLDEAERSAFLGLVAGGMSGNWQQQLQGLVGLGALPGDGDLDALGRELGLDRPAVDPSSLAPEELAREAGRLARVLLDAGARLPKPLMLWGKNLAFLDATVGRLCPDRDLIQLITGVMTSFFSRHGAALGGALSASSLDRSAVAAALAAGDGGLTWGEMRERRRTIVERQSRRERRGSRRTAGR